MPTGGRVVSIGGYRPRVSNAVRDVIATMRREGHTYQAIADVVGLPRPTVAYIGVRQVGATERLANRLLLLLCESGEPMRIRDIAKDVGKSPNATRYSVGALAKRGLVERGENPNLNNILYVQPTAAGRARARKLLLDE